jgi:F0F1-type ATP synthase assembly protein I
VIDESRPSADSEQSPRATTGEQAPASLPARPGGRADPASRIRGKPFFSSVDASLLGIGSQMLSEVAAGVLLGYGLDYLLGTRNRWIVVGSLAGIAVAMVSVFRLALKTQPPRRLPPGSQARDGGAPSTVEGDEMHPGPRQDNPSEAGRSPGTGSERDRRRESGGAA